MYRVSVGSMTSGLCLNSTTARCKSYVLISTYCRKYKYSIPTREAPFANLRSLQCHWNSRVQEAATNRPHRPQCPLGRDLGSQISFLRCFQINGLGIIVAFCGTCSVETSCSVHSFTTVAPDPIVYQFSPSSLKLDTFSFISP